MNKVEKIDEYTTPSHVLASVTDKTGLDMLVPGIFENVPGSTIISTGGTARHIEKIMKDQQVAGATLWRASQYTGQPETQGGLVKTLDFKIYLGLLTETYNPEHQTDLARTNASPINLVIVNLYPFEEVITKNDVDFELARGNIDIGGPTMIRAALKNFHRVAVVVDPGDYPDLLDELQRFEGQTSLSFRVKMMKKAIHHTHLFDKAIDAYMSQITEEEIRKCYGIAYR